MTVIELRRRASHKPSAAAASIPWATCMFAFPWGGPGTALATEGGPEDWQREVLQQLGRTAGARARRSRAAGRRLGPRRRQVGAGRLDHPVGAVDDARHARCGHRQHRRAAAHQDLARARQVACACDQRDWFAYTATSLHSVRAARQGRTWRVDAITWSENNTEAIAGLHNKGRRAFALFDEASAIADGVWETIEGALTDADTELFWLVFGNPTRNTGRFRECFAGGRFAHRWRRQIDSRSVSMTNKGQIAKWVQDYGEESDFIRVRVKGVFPRAGTMQFIDSERVAGRRSRAVQGSDGALVMGVDIARQGEDQTVIRFRRGLDARSIPAVKFRIPDLMQVASRVLEQVGQHKPAAVFVDATGIGWGVFDRLAQLGCEA